LHGAAVAIPVEEYEAVLRHEGAEKVFPRQHIYHRAFEVTLLQATRAACRYPKDLMVFVHDDGNDFNDLHTIFRSYIKKNPLTGKHLTSFLSMDDKTTPGLQIADMFANAIQWTTVRFVTGAENVHSGDIFMFDRSKINVWTRELGEEVLARAFKGRGIPIPESLESAIATHTENPTITDRRKSKHV
jgi:hypothetical protein